MQLVQPLWRLSAQCRLGGREQPQEKRESYLRLHRLQRGERSNALADRLSKAVSLRHSFHVPEQEALTVP